MWRRSKNNRETDGWKVSRIGYTHSTLIITYLIPAWKGRFIITTINYEAMFERAIKVSFFFFPTQFSPTLDHWYCVCVCVRVYEWHSIVCKFEKRIISESCTSEIEEVSDRDNRFNEWEACPISTLLLHRFYSWQKIFLSGVSCIPCTEKQLIFLGTRGTRVVYGERKEDEAGLVGGRAAWWSLHFYVKQLHTVLRIVGELLHGDCAVVVGALLCRDFFFIFIFALVVSIY